MTHFVENIYLVLFREDTVERIETCVSREVNAIGEVEQIDHFL